MLSCYNLRDVVKVNIHLSLMVEAVICLFINEFKKPPLRKRKLLEQEQENNINEFKKPPLRKRKLQKNLLVQLAGEQEQDNKIVKKMIQRVLVLVNQDQDLDQKQNP